MHEMNETERQIVAYLEKRIECELDCGFSNHALLLQSCVEDIQSGQYREIEGE